MAIVDHGEIVKAKGYGVADRQTKVPVTTATLFQAGSVSKSVAAMGAWRLVAQGRLVLDQDVNTSLRSWQLPENKFTQTNKVTLREILCHSAGLTVHGFPGYVQGKRVPTLVQVLDGAGPANTSAVRVDIAPGSKWQYSGGGYTIMQQMMIDVTGETFPQYMQEAVLHPLHMTNSTYEQPPPAPLVSATATGYYADGKMVTKRWHIYPEMAAAGLWSTATDLAEFVIGLQQALTGTATPLISQATARQMVTEQRDHDGLGVFLAGKGKALRFYHNGRDDGFDAGMVGYVETGQGAVLLINANDASGALLQLFEAIAKVYNWPDYH